jgi:hypothetical protein
MEKEWRIVAQHVTWFRLLAAIQCQTRIIISTTWANGSAADSFVP